jgi:hypothetical protein
MWLRISKLDDGCSVNEVFSRVFQRKSSQIVGVYREEWPVSPEAIVPSIGEVWSDEIAAGTLGPQTKKNRRRRKPRRRI